MRRSYLRFLRSDKYIPPAYILDEVGDAPTSMYREAVESGLFTSHQRYTNDVPRGQKARLLESGGEIPDGQLLGAAADEASLADRLRAATWPDGQLVFTLPMVLGLLVFYALCLQCAATLAVIKRETNGWGWPLFAWSYMTGLGYLGELLVFQIGSA